MQVHRSFIIILVIITFTLGPAEAGVVSWVKGKVSRKLPWIGKKNSLETSDSTNDDGQVEAAPAGAETNTGEPPNNLKTSNTKNNNGKGKEDDTGAQIKPEKSQNAHPPGSGFGSTNGVVLWSGDVFWLNRRQYTDDRQQCVEEINLVWHTEKKGKMFKPKCTKYGSFRTVFHEKGLLIVGSPSDEFFVFSSKKNEYFYKENGKWIKGNIIDGEIKEADMTPSEIKAVKRRISKWTEVADKLSNNLKNIGEEQVKEAQRTARRTQRINNQMMAELEKNQNNLNDIGTLRKKEYARQVKEQVEYETMVRAQGWNADVQNFQNEMQSKVEHAENDIRAKEAVEQDRYKRVTQDLHNQLIKENARHQQENHRFHQLYNQQRDLFDREYQGLVNKGY